MAETLNYGLYLTESSQEKFIDWREKMNGKGEDSNMQKIDKALGEKADHSKDIEAVLSAEAWIGDSAPYTQALTITDLKSGGAGNITLSDSATTEQIACATYAMLDRQSQEDGKLVMVAFGRKPELDIPVHITLID